MSSGLESLWGLLPFALDSIRAEESMGVEWYVKSHSERHLAGFSLGASGSDSNSFETSSLLRLERVFEENSVLCLRQCQCVISGWI
jgi:hypothetical protein